jgi:hypothetical protein
MPFSNPIMGGQNFIRPVMSSPNFSIGDQTGWAVYENGNAYFFNITASGTITSTTVIVSGAGEGIFVYSGTPLLGTLVASVTNSSGTDDVGNEYLGGIVSYQPGAPATAAVLASASLLFYSAPGSGGPWTAGAVVGTNASDTLLMSSGGPSGDPTESILGLVPSPTGQASTAQLSNAALALTALSAGTTFLSTSVFTQLYALADGHVQYLAPTGTGSDNNTYDIGRLTLATTGTQTFNSTSGVAVTGLSASVSATTYRVKIRIYITTAAAAGNAEINFTGPATASMLFTGTWNEAGTSGGVIPRESTALGTTFTSFGLATPTTQFLDVEGIVTFSAAGTLVVQGTCTNAADTFVTQPGSFLELLPVG